MLAFGTVVRILCSDIPRPYHVRVSVLGTVLRNMFLSFKAILIPHDSARDFDKKLFSLVCRVAVSGFFPSCDEREEKCIFLSCAESAVFIHRVQLSRNTVESCVYNFLYFLTLINAGPRKTEILVFVG